MSETEKSVKFVARLVRLTKDKNIKWSAIKSPRSENESAYGADINGRNVIIYRYSEDVPNSEYARYSSSKNLSYWVISRNSDVIPPQTVRREGVTLEVLDSDTGRPVYKFEAVSGLRDLFESASYSAAKVDELMDSVLAQEIQPQK